MTEFVSTALLIVIIFALGIFFGAIMTLFIGGYSKTSHQPKHYRPEYNDTDEGEND